MKNVITGVGYVEISEGANRRLYGFEKYNFDLISGKIYARSDKWPYELLIDGTATLNGNPATITEIFEAILGAYINTNFVYLDTPDAPVFADCTTINPTTSPIETADLGGKTDICLGAGTHAPAVRILNVVGTELTPVRFKGAGGTDNPRLTQIGNDNPANTYAFGIQGGDWIEVYDLLVYGNNGLRAEAQQKNVKFQNVIVQNTFHFHGFTSKTDNDNTIPAYKVIIFYCEVPEGVTGEGIYVGQTVGAVFHNLSLCHVKHFYCYKMGREAVQFAHCEDLLVEHLTGLLCAQANTAGQNKLMQILDSNGIVRNSIFTNGNGTSDSYDHRADGVTFKNCFFKGYRKWYFANVTGQTWYATSTIKGNKPIVIDNCIICITNPDEIYLIECYLDVCDITVQNCVLSSTISALFGDSRLDKLTYDLIDGGGNIYLPITHPIFSPSFDARGRITTSIHYRRGLGWRVNDPTYPTAASITLSGVAALGGTLTGSVNGFDPGTGVGEGTHLYQWYRADDGVGTNEAAIAGETSISHDIIVADQGRFLRLGVRLRNSDYLVADETYSGYTSVAGAATTTIFVNFGALAGEKVGGNYNDIDDSVFKAAPGVWVADLIDIDAGAATGIGITGIKQVDYDRDGLESGAPYFAPHNLDPIAMKYCIASYNGSASTSINFKLTGLDPGKTYDLYFFCSCDTLATYEQDIQVVCTGGNVKSDSMADAYNNTTETLECLDCLPDGGNEIDIELDVLTKGTGQWCSDILAFKIVEK